MEQEATLGGLFKLREHVLGILRINETPNPEVYREEDLLNIVSEELDAQRKTLAYLFGPNSYRGKDEYLGSLPKDPKKIKKHLGIPLTPIIVDPGILPQVAAEKTDFSMKCEPADISNWTAGGVWIPSKPYIVWVAVDSGRNLQQAIGVYRNNLFFRGSTATEGLFASLFFRNLLNLDAQIITLGSRIEDIYIPSIGRNPDGRKEIGNPVLPLDSNEHLASILIAAR